MAPKRGRRQVANAEVFNKYLLNNFPSYFKTRETINTGSNEQDRSFSAVRLEEGVPCTFKYCAEKITIKLLFSKVRRKHELIKKETST